IGKGEFTVPGVDLEPDKSDRELATKQEVENYQQRQTAVAQDDLRAFEEYLKEKAKASKDAPPRQTKLKEDPTRPTGFSRRGVLRVVRGSAIGGSAVVAGHSLITKVTNGSIPDHGAKHAGDRYTEAQRHNITRQLIDSTADLNGRGLGKWVALLPTKMGGG